MNLPNKLTILRIAMIPVFMAFFFLTMIPYNYFIAAIVFVLGGGDRLSGRLYRPQISSCDQSGKISRSDRG